MKENLTTHLAQITFSLLNQLTEKGVILTQSNSHVEADIVSTHHVIELLNKINGNVFLHYIENSIHYYTKPENGVVSSLFSVDTLSQLLPNNSEVEKLVDDILKSQLESGAFTKYTAFLIGGDFFSTLWCMKLLINTGNSKYSDNIKNGFGFLSKNITDKGISINQKGFFYLLSAKFGFTGFDKEVVKNELIDYITNIDINAENLLWHLYIYEDLLYENDELLNAKVGQLFKDKFELSKKADSFPKVFESLQNTSAESVFYQCLARFCIVGLNFIDSNDILKLSFDINKLIQSNGQQAVYKADVRERQLKEFLSLYGGIHQEFNKYNDVLEKIWKEQTEFDKSVFIMMPFKNEIGYNATAKMIKSACKKKGFKAIRIDDKDRQFHKTLWDNLVINLLSCKYAIAIYASDQIVDVLDKNSPKMFPNPNVALEFGFFTSRGQDVLLLRDLDSPIPSDLQGFIWNGFNIKNPGNDVKQAVNDYLDNIIEKEKQ